jgi:spermidine/putrescine transport system ATP-binding protein
MKKEVKNDEYIIELNNVKKKFDDSDVYAVENFNLKIKKGEFVTFLGPSGCGKTTTLRMIAGFEMPTSGQILLAGNDISLLPPYKRPINTVFQRYALFTHLNIYKNIAFGLQYKRVPNTDEPILNKDGTPVLDEDGNPTYKMRKLTKKEIKTKVKSALKLVDLEGFEKRSVSTLSGGQQQRIAIARAIVNEPEILLLDEPLGALDLKMRKEMQLELKAMHKKLGITFIYVTHDQEEALTMSDTIVVMSDGEIQQVGTPKEIYDEPVNAFVADFIGESSIYTGTVLADNKLKFLGATWNSDPADEGKFTKNEKVDIVIRPEDAEIVSKDKGTIVATIVSKIFKGMHYEYIMMVKKNELIVQSTKDYNEGDEVGIVVEPTNIQIMKKPFTSNYFDGHLTKHYNVSFAGIHHAFDVLKLFPGCTWNEDHELINEKGEVMDVEDTQVTVEIGFDDIELSDNLSLSELHGEIINMIYLGDHYEVTVWDEESEEEFIVSTPDLWNLNDKVALVIKDGGIDVKLKGGAKKHA